MLCTKGIWKIPHKKIFNEWNYMEVQTLKIKKQKLKMYHIIFTDQFKYLKGYFLQSFYI